MEDLVHLRRFLHAAPELSGRETETAREVFVRLDDLAPDRLWTKLGGHGVAAEFQGKAPGPTVLVRAELDALPIHEQSELPYSSTVPGCAHLCGHDGHMTILMGLARRIAQEPLASGRFIALFQPAEETGEGARAVCADPRFPELRPDYAFALHNLPGTALGTVALRDGTFNCASRGIVVNLSGATAHAAHPEDGKSPALAMCALLKRLTHIHEDPSLPESGLRLSTVVHANLGEVAFGTSPGEAVLMATLRAEHDATLEAMAKLAEDSAHALAQEHGLRAEVAWRDRFEASVNTPAAAALIRAAANQIGAPVEELKGPFRWSEDFGALGAQATHSAMFGLGAGVAHPPLHSTTYDFPDPLIERGIALFEAAVRGCASR